MDPSVSYLFQLRGRVRLCDPGALADLLLEWQCYAEELLGALQDASEDRSGNGTGTASKARKLPPEELSPRHSWLPCSPEASPAVGMDDAESGISVSSARCIPAAQLERNGIGWPYLASIIGDLVPIWLPCIGHRMVLVEPPSLDAHFGSLPKSY
jgi:hypothetical protein